MAILSSTVVLSTAVRGAGTGRSLARVAGLHLASPAADGEPRLARRDHPLGDPGREGLRSLGKGGLRGGD